LKSSAMALDLYAWAVWRSFTVAQSGKVQFIPWRGLMQQMGADYSNPDDFRRKAKAALKKVTAVYPGLKVEQVDGGINLLPSSRPAVASRPKKLSTKSGG
ncbi:MAG: replication protein, partial [Proteobacteria bacterium]|nr:replication protein [Pseudomonadota bacterium]